MTIHFQRTVPIFRIFSLEKARGLLPKFDSHADVFVLIEDETLRAPSLRLIQELRSAGARGRKRKAVRDQVAAQLILQDYLDRRSAA